MVQKFEADPEDMRSNEDNFKGGRGILGVLSGMSSGSSGSGGIAAEMTWLLKKFSTAHGGPLSRRPHNAHGARLGRSSGARSAGPQHRWGLGNSQYFHPFRRHVD